MKNVVYAQSIHPHTPFPFSQVGKVGVFPLSRFEKLTGMQMYHSRQAK